jgi:hypothetical protein
MYNMFRGASSFDSDLGDWDVSKCTTLNGMFDGARSFTGRRLYNWNVSECRNMIQTFDGVRFDVWDRTKKWRAHPKCKSENNVSYRSRHIPPISSHSNRFRSSQPTGGWDHLLPLPRLPLPTWRRTTRTRGQLIRSGLVPSLGRQSGNGLGIKRTPYHCTVT